MLRHTHPYARAHTYTDTRPASRVVPVWRSASVCVQAACAREGVLLVPCADAATLRVRISRTTSQFCTWFSPPMDSPTSAG